MCLKYIFKTKILHMKLPQFWENPKAHSESLRKKPFRQQISSRMEVFIAERIITIF